MACSERLAIAIEKTASTDNNSSLELWENMKTLPGFGLDFLAHYYAYLVENPRTAIAFQVLENAQKMIWVARYVKNTFPDFVPSVDPSDGESEGWLNLTLTLVGGAGPIEVVIAIEEDEDGGGAGTGGGGVVLVRTGVGGGGA